MGTAQRERERMVVVVPVDFSPPSRRAMAWAFDYAQRAPCDLHLVHVVERHWSLADLRADLSDVQTELAQVTDAAREELDGMAPTEEQRATIGDIQRHISTGKPVKEILRLARELDADMIVMGTHGHTGVERVLIGSVCERIVREAPCTVVAVKPH